MTSSNTCHLDNDERFGYNSIIQPLLTDMYQIKMAYVYWKTGKLNDRAVFDLFFRKNPFQGEFTIFAGLNDCLKFIQKFKYSKSDIKYLKSVLPSRTEDEFFEYLEKINVNDLEVYGIDEGSVVFPKEPLLRIEGPLILVQILETTLLTLVNFASLMATNAARYRLAAGSEVQLVEFGLRRAQGPDGGLSASKYSFIGGFDGTSNLLAGKFFNIPVTGTHAHSFITSFTGTQDIESKFLCHKTTNASVNFLELSKSWRSKLAEHLNLISETNNGELEAFVSYAIAFPNEFIALVDTYDVRRSGLLNFCAVSMALNDLEYKARGIRIDSGDLAYLSQCAYTLFTKIANTYNIPWFQKVMIMVSNDINEEIIISLSDQRNEIKGFGIGTHLVTCQKQPALGCVYKMVELNNCARMKLSQDFEKMNIPGKKDTFRLYNSEGFALIDLIQKADEKWPEIGQKVLCRHPFDRSKRCYVVPRKVEKLLNIYWKNGKIVRTLPTLTEIKKKVQDSLLTIRPDIKRYLNPTPYKIGVTEIMYNYIQNLWLEITPIAELV